MASLLSDHVYERLYAAMLEKRIGPGDRLNRRQVATDLGVSVAPVLEAMTQLEWEGFLETVPRRGTIVRPITARQVLGKFHLRMAIEVEAARLAAGPPIAAARHTLLPAARRADAAIPYSLACWEHEVEFHTLLVACAGSIVLAEAFRQVMRHGLLHAANELLPGGRRRVSDIHKRLFERLATATPDEADALLREHLASWIKPLTQLAAQEPPEQVPVPTRRRKSRRPRRPA
jgi:DNA-binding GntR family transcriptional regulator